ncbi:MAG: ABC transporter permease [Steroidobacteraceae bacterium]|nr:ABC transporter permease [Steroidobacteraceae bacterium]MDW8259314.1 ABC transporter permease [Gammaproteobacteria bacterium]
MRAADVVSFAAQSLRRARLRSGMMLLAVAIGVAAVVALTALGEGARRYVTAEFAALGTNLVIVIPGRTATGGVSPALMTGDTPRDLTLDDMEAIRRLPTVLDAAPVVIGQATASAGRRERDTTVLGTTASWLTVRQWTVRSGQFLPRTATDRTAPVCVIGIQVARELFPDRSALGQWLRIGDRRYRVIGLLGTEGRSLGFDAQDIVIVPVSAALAMFNRTSLFRILIQARSHESMIPTRDAVRALLRDRHQGQEDVTVVTQDAIVATFNTIFGALTAALAGIAAVSLLVAGVLIMNVMLVAVSQRTAEIGLLKALGARRAQIASLFLAEAVLLAVAGALCGLAAGGAATVAIRELLPIEAAPPWWAIGAGFATAIGSGLVFGLLPARRAARLDPVLALARKL